ncbi:MAG TPA: hypothetical protein VF147_04475 [Vicinamibacterales bacterium]
MAGLSYAPSSSRRQTPPIPQAKGRAGARSAKPASSDRRSAEQVLDAQRTAGNQAVASDAARRWTLTIGGEKLEQLTSSQALEALGRHYRRVHSAIEGGFEGHKFLMELQRDQPFAAYVSETLGGVDMPDIGIWDKARDATFAARKAIKAGDIDAAVKHVSIAVDEYDKAYRTFAKYRDGTEAGADRAITGLKVTAAAGAVAATIATGGAASAAGAGLLGTSAVVGGTAGVYGASQEFAGQASEVYIAETRKSFDVGAILKRGATDAIVGFVGSIAGGMLAKQFAKMFGSYLSKANIADDVLREMGEALGMKGPLPRDFFLTGGQRFVADFLAGIGTTPLTVAVTTAVNRFTGAGKMPSTSEFLENVLQEMATGGALQIFIGLITRGKGHGTPSSKGGGKKAPGSKAGKTTPEIEIFQNKKAANDNVEVTGPAPEPSAAAKPEVEFTAANDNVEITPAAAEEMATMKLAAGAEGMTTQTPARATRGGSEGGGPGSSTGRPTKTTKTGATGGTRPGSTTSAKGKTAKARSAKASAAPKGKDKRGNQPISAAKAKAAQEKRAKVEAKIAAEQQELRTTAESSRETSKQLGTLTNQRRTRPPELEAEWNKLPSMKDPEARLDAIRDLQAREGWSPEAQEYLEWQKQTLDARAQQEGNAVGGKKTGEKVQKMEIADLPDATAEVRKASQSVKQKMRKQGDNYKAKKKVRRDQVFDEVDETGWEAYAKSQGKKRMEFSPDHLVALDRIANFPEMVEFYTVYESASPKAQEQMVTRLEGLGDIPDNLVSMQRPANQAKGNRSWHDIEPAAFEKYGYEMKHVLAMRKREDEMLVDILKAVKKIADDFRGK